MNIKVRALIKTLKMLSISALVPLTLLLIFQLDAEVLLYLLCFGFFSYILWIVYSINLTGLENEETLSKMKENNEQRISNIIKK
ncbi:hypothetical protein UFOVP257_288 [uncultured Caudovirales phage]|uniref:Uncharacterized protein n=1 Tax=uncultured Caudovirales phage TaxID=2100421 RepID=A0A6J5LKB2_9CAUD|nr:hypothetical protein UFOVP257_288 [uncultured Caudovirales phage]